jgi:hypothetical protein
VELAERIRFSYRGDFVLDAVICLRCLYGRKTTK